MTVAALSALVAALYVATGAIGLSLSHYQDNATLIWPPTGLSLAALILFGRRLWPGVFAGALLVSMITDVPVWPSVGIAVGNTLEAVVGALVLERVGFCPSMSRVRDVVAFLLVGAIGCTTLSATIGVSCLDWAGQLATTDAGLVWTIWWLGDVGGAVAVAPLLLLGARGRPAWATLARLRESWIVLACLGLGSTVAFGGVTTGPWSLLAAFVPFPFLVWAGARLGSRGAVMASGLTTILATIGTAQRLGPFAGAEPQTNLMLLWAYGITIGAAALILAAVIAERELAEQQRRAEETNRLRLERTMNRVQRLEGLGVLAGGVAHDFNNILVAIQGNADLLASYVNDNPDAQNLVEQIRLASERAAELCRHLLAYAGRKDVTKEPVPLSDLIGEIDSLLGAAVSKKVVIDTNLERCHHAVEGDPTLLRQVVMNLVLNGAEAIGDSGGTVTVTTGTVDLDAKDLSHMLATEHAEPGPFVFIEVRDDGAGMTSKTVERMFDPFFTTKFQGRGLGLAAVLGIVQTHHGAIQVKSQAGAGTTARVYLPPLANAPPPAAPAAPPVIGRGDGRSVLVADDEPAVLRVVTRILEGAGFDVLSACNGREAVELFRQRKDDLHAALFDITMPMMTGVEALHEVRAICADIPVLLMTGHEPDAEWNTQKAAALIRKPFTRDDILEPLQAALPARRSPLQQS